MNIQEAKEEIEKAVKAYTARTEAGTLKIPLQRQRPVLLIGPPGIGKTAIMEQIARDCSIGLVAYTMTHHTRQSAIGLPVLEQRKFDGTEYTVTSYTMSEIIASVYEQMEKSGCREGILFLDEINCVSETLMPAMLQFLQYKTFGSHRLPEGWVIVAAGNPPAYNRSVREFDTVTLDRVRRMTVEPDLKVWKEYAIERRLHPAVLSFLELRPERFYVMEPGHTGFVTGRAWEDLSEILLTMEELGLGVEETLFGQYLQDEETALEFSFYYRIYERWKIKLKPEKILAGDWEEPGETASELPSLAFDERLCIVWLLLQSILDLGARLGEQQKLSESLQFFVEGLNLPESPGAGGDSKGQDVKEKNAKEENSKGTVRTGNWEKLIQERLDSRQKGLAVRKENGLLSVEEEEREKKLSGMIRTCTEDMRLKNAPGCFAEKSREEAEKTRAQRQKLASAMERAAEFIRRAVGNRQEWIVFLTGLTEHPVCREVLKKEVPQLWSEAEQLLNADSREEELRKKLQG